jgi:ubiquinone/menaquinone biosynthesis C-methylase UbiE
MDELELIIDLHSNSERQGPGGDQDTLKELSMMNLPADRKLKIADIGCGSGGQTITLAQHLNAEITAVDLFPAFLDELNDKAGRFGLSEKIDSHSGSMEELPFENESLDIIWSEGAIYNMGFERGIKKWKSYLKTGGYLAVSEITWIRNSRPKEIEEFWTAEYPEIAPASEKIRLLEANGYILSGYFYLSPESWLENYYIPMENRLESFLNRNGNSDLAKKVADDSRAEIEQYRKFKDYYSYGFYIARKIN